MTTDKKGFTIIEVLLALSIVGVILGVIFLAIPGAKISSENNLRTGDVAKVINAMRQHAKDGVGWRSVFCFGGVFTDTIPDLSYYDKSTQLTFSCITPAPVTNTMTEGILVQVGGKCDGPNAIPAVDATYNQSQVVDNRAAVLYAARTRTGHEPRCVEVAI